MTNIIMVFSKSEDGKSIRGIPVRNNFQVVAVCTSGAQALSATEGLNSSIVVSGCQFEDMLYDKLRQYLPGTFDILLISSPSRWGGQAPGNVVYLPMSLKVHDLLNTLEIMVRVQMRFRRKMRDRPEECGGEEQNLIARAKQLLMKRNNMTEPGIHRYIQKCSMDNGINLVETVQMAISLIHV